jgi:UDP-glucose 4-epimerase
MKALVIGSNGYIGRHLCYFLLNMKWVVIGYDRESISSINLTNYYSLNILDKIQISKIDLDFDYIFFFSGITGTIRGYEEFEQYIDINEKGLLNVLDWMRKNKSIARIIFPSTRLVYKGVKNIKLGEGAEKEFKTIYALNKWFGEQVIQQYNNYFGINFNVFRICIPYGNFFDDNYSYGTVGAFLKKAKAGEDLVLYGTGEQKRTFTHIEDLCLQIVHTIEQPITNNNIYNIEGETFSLYEIAIFISNKFKLKIKFVEWPEIEKKFETGDTIFLANRINKILKYQLKNSFEKWVANLDLIKDENEIIK